MDIKSLKSDFPIFKNIPSLVYLDSTATSLKPKSVIDKEIEYYEKYSANVFRGVYKISEKATEEYEETRKIVADFINAEKTEEVIFTRNTTESLNLIAYSLGRKIINPRLTVIVDAAQAVPHLKVDVQDLGCDFLVFSSHKMLGPTGVGVLWGKYELLDQMFPFNYGGEMIQEVYIDKTIFKKPPHQFEAGTPHIAGVIALKEAVKYLEKIGYEKIRKHEILLAKSLACSLQAEFGKKIKILAGEIF